MIGFARCVLQIISASNHLVTYVHMLTSQMSNSGTTYDINTFKFNFSFLFCRTFIPEFYLALNKL